MTSPRARALVLAAPLVVGSAAALAQTDLSGSTAGGMQGATVFVLVIGAAIAGYWLGRGHARPARRVISVADDDADKSAFEALAVAIDDVSASVSTSAVTSEPTPPGQKAVHPDEKPLASLARLRHADRLASIGKMASSMAHEMGTPLMVIRGNAQLILMDAEDTEEVVTLSEVIVDQTARLREIIETMLNYTRRRRPAVALEPQRVAHVVESAATLLAFEADDRDVEIQSSGSDILEAVLDRGKMLQLLTNIGTNAVHASRAGDTVTLEWEAIERDGAAWLVVRIRDEGVGMSEEQLSRITEPFYTTKPEGEGTGLGMAICAQILEELDGDIGIESVLGEGTVVSINVPIDGGVAPVTT